MWPKTDLGVRITPPKISGVIGIALVFGFLQSWLEVLVVVTEASQVLDELVLLLNHPLVVHPVEISFLVKLGNLGGVSLGFGFALDLHCCIRARKYS